MPQVALLAQVRLKQHAYHKFTSSFSHGLGLRPPLLTSVALLHHVLSSLSLPKVVEISSKASKGFKEPQGRQKHVSTHQEWILVAGKPCPKKSTPSLHPTISGRRAAISSSATCSTLCFTAVGVRYFPRLFCYPQLFMMAQDIQRL